MDLIDKLQELANRVPKLKKEGLVTTEEGTKNALVMPFIAALGYDVFNPLEVTPELNADIGTKKGEKVDYAVLSDGKPIILIECKGFDADLRKVHASQLYRYFSVTQARFGILTNGIVYQFYSDLEEPNKMDHNPFMVFDLTAVNEASVAYLKQFTKAAFDQDKIINKASELKYRSAIKAFLEHEFVEPSESFIRLCLKDSYNGRFTQNAVIEFQAVVKSALTSFISDMVEKRLKSALESEKAAQVEQAPSPTQEVATVDPEGIKIVTTKDSYHPRRTGCILPCKSDSA
ncbi:MAG: hypothetical protein OHK0046_37220 [Anaerolineae bacterium]